MRVCRAETDAVLVNAGVHWQPFSELALAELPQVASADDWHLPEQDMGARRDLRGSEYFICSIDPPGQQISFFITALCIYFILFCFILTNNWCMQHTPVNGISLF